LTELSDCGDLRPEPDPNVLFGFLFQMAIGAGALVMSKIVSGTGVTPQNRSTEAVNHPDQTLRFDSRTAPEIARLIGQPEGPYGTSVVSRQTVLLRSLGAARFSKFETLEIAKHGMYVVCQAPQGHPFQKKTTLLEIQLFLGDPAAAGTQLIKCFGHIEDVRAAIDLPVPSPSGYVVRILQISTEDSVTLEKFVLSQLAGSVM